MRTTRAQAAGTLDGRIDGTNLRDVGARERFIKWHPTMPESDWPEYREAYEAAFGEALAFMRGEARP